MGVVRYDEAQKEIRVLKSHVDELKKSNVKLTSSLAAGRKTEESIRNKLTEAEKKVLVANSR